MQKRKNTSKIILVFAVAFLATIVSYSAFYKMEKQINAQNQLINLMQNTQTEMKSETYAYAYAIKDLKAGEIVSEEDVDFKNFEEENKGAFENRSDVVNKVLLADIAKDEPFTTAQIAKISDGETVREGYRGLTLPSESFTGRAATMKLGTSVDVYTTGSDETWELNGVKIISLEASNPIAQANSVLDAQSITFEVPAGDIAEFISHVSTGKPVLVAKNQAERTVRKPKKVQSFEELPSLPPPMQYDNLSGLPMPLAPTAAAPSQVVELIEANVKTKVTFD